MKKRSCAILSALCLLLTLCGCDGGADVSADPSALASETGVIETAAPDALPTVELSQRERDWIEDIEFLREEYKTRHIDPFYLCSEEEFDWKLDQLAAKVGQLSDEDIAFELVSVVAGMGDPHTSVYPTSPLYARCFPVTAAYFDGKLYLTSYQEGHEQLEPWLLHEVVAVNGVDITYLNDKADSIGNPFNSWLSKDFFASYYFIPAFFDWAGCDYTEGYTFQILNDDREVVSVDIPVITNEQWRAGAWIYPADWDNIPYFKTLNWAEYFEGDNGGCVYLSLRMLTGKTAIENRVKEAGALLAEHPDCHKLAIDFRKNPGGNAELLEAVRENVELLEADQTYVLTDGMTASAAMTFIAFFKDELGAVTVGEPTGQFTSMFHYSSLDQRSVLPNSQISVQISTKWWDGDPIVEERYDENGRLYQWESTVLPDVFVYQDIEDIRQGKDSAIQWVLAR